VKYIHDCSECIYLGDYEMTYSYGVEVVDLYFHWRKGKDGLRSEALIRLGDVGWEYESTWDLRATQRHEAYAKEACRRVCQYSLAAFS
jgi:hypothetical protein